MRQDDHSEASGISTSLLLDKFSAQRLGSSRMQHGIVWSSLCCKSSFISFGVNVVDAHGNGRGRLGVVRDERVDVENERKISINGGGMQISKVGSTDTVLP